MRGKRPVLIPALLLGVVVVVGCAGGPGPVSSDRPGPAAAGQYTVVVDAGSSGTRARVFAWRPQPGKKLPAIETIGSAKDFRRLSDMADDPDGVKENFRGLISFLERTIPPAQHRRADVHVMATAGMRLLPGAKQRQIHAELTEFLKINSPFAIKESRTLDGTEEAVFGWLSVNYLAGILKREGLFPTMGALDLGGASTQITFLPLDHPKKDRFDVTLGDDIYALYAISYLGLGQDKAFERLATGACLQNGYQHDVLGTGTGDYDRCLADVAAGLKDKRYCIPDKACGVPGEDQPPLFGDFIAFSTFYYAASFYELGQRWSLRDLQEAGRRSCAVPWQELAARRADIEEQYLKKYCFSAAYIVALLNQGYGFPMDAAALISTKDLQGDDIDWTLGALIWLARKTE